MKSRWRYGGSLLLAAGALALGGCGGASSSARSSEGFTSASPASGSSLSRSAFIARADAICKRLNAEMAKVKAKSTSLPEITRVAPVHAALEQGAVSELGQLVPPSSIAREWQQIVAYRRTLAAELVKLGKDAKAKDSAGVKALTASKRSVHKQLLAAGAQAGFKDCPQVG
jgi:hypothetical protein